MEAGRKLLAEGLGTAFLAAAVIGAGIMAGGLTDNAALALLVTAATSALALYVMITVMMPVSGGHLNPAVTLAFALRREIAPAQAVAYVAAQVAGGMAGILLTHAMFGLPLAQVSQTARSGGGLWLAEGVATFGLILVILGALNARANVAAIVAAFIGAAYWFTASSGFANPALTLVRAFTDTPGGIRPADVPGFLIGETLGALLAVALGGWLFSRTGAARES
ncbi:aquaporin family protein [Rhodobacter sp. SGA-6-6]|uniref:aquaporin n=1 Tax=Rhodobacter sp. SGA-6-6 TaxID=2710882 RepID=UPI0013ED2367|nr:aquaporin [Rhodobacter sp. SGA-6-6]NGM44174.1 aquaporin family protein [Rhodobacter sp. SGA-6-6]